VAPGYEEEAMGIFEGKNVRLMKIEPFGKKFLGDPFEYKKLDGGVLVGEPWNSRIVSPEFVEVRAGSPTEDDVRAAMLQWLICGFTKSNAVVVGDSSRAFGIGSGQTSRIDAAFMALYKATARGKYPDGAKGLVAASDAFWPFPDGAEMLGKAGVKGCMYPLGSNKDQEVIDAFSEQGMFVLTPRPHPDRPTDIERAFY
jgi:phosphoribosylaminoimidazolecarboxamide formyltransferase/IMP cyclohydrolase